MSEHTHTPVELFDMLADAAMLGEPQHKRAVTSRPGAYRILRHQVDALPDLLEACERLLADLWTHVGKRNVRKHYRLMIAEVAAQNAIRKAKGGDPQ